MLVNSPNPLTLRSGKDFQKLLLIGIRVKLGDLALLSRSK